MSGTCRDRGLANPIGRIAHSIALALILTVPLAASPAGAEDERPDLQIKLRGLDGQRDVKLSITNDSEWWANETTVTVETVSPGAANRKTLFVENLDPGQTTSVTYTLAVDCDGHVVKADVAAAKNYAGVAESSLGNNRLQTQVCPAKNAPKPEPKPQPKPGGVAVETGPISGPIISTDTGVVTRRIPDELVVAKHLQPGTHTLPFKPKETISVGRVKTHLTFPDPAQGYPAGWQPVVEVGDKTPLLAGWGQRETPGIQARFSSYQVLSRFDLELLDQVPIKLVSHASLTFDETPFDWSNEAGDGEDKSGCATSLGRFRFETDFNSVRGLIETEYVNDIPPGGQSRNVLGQIIGREVNVTQHILGYVQYPTFFIYQPNFVLRPELEDGDGDDNERCISRISDVELHVTYVVPD